MGGALLVAVAITPVAAAPAPASAAGTGTWGHTDFDGDGDDELVIAVPSESLGTIQDAGAVTVLNGAPGGTRTAASQIWTQGTPGLAGQAATGDRFGESWTSGDFDEDGYDDLAIGIPGDNLRGAVDAGRVQVLFGGNHGLTTAGQQLIEEFRADVPAAGDRFGTALAAGDFDNDGDEDLVVGAPGEEVGGDPGAGAVFFYRATAAGFVSAPSRWSQHRAGVSGAAEPGDGFGAALTAGRAGQNSRDDLVVGVPREDTGGGTDAGVVQVLYGSGTSFSTATDQLFALGDFEEGVGGLVADEELSSDDGDRFGTAVALTEQGGTSLPVLVAGAPFDDDPGDDPAVDVGAIGVLVGSDGAGLVPVGGLSPGGLGDPDDVVAGQQFGRAVTGLDSGVWAVSWPGEDIGSDTDAGMVSVLDWVVDDEGEGAGEVRERQGDTGEDNEDDDQFGGGVWSADVDGDGAPELAVGWRESFEDEGVTQGGMVAVGGTSGGYDVFSQSTPGVPETNQNFDRLGVQAVP